MSDSIHQIGMELYLRRIQMTPEPSPYVRGLLDKAREINMAAKKKNPLTSVIESLVDKPNVLVYPTSFNAELPDQQYEGDVGYDLYLAYDYTIFAGQSKDCATDIKIQLPPGIWGRIVGRSSTIRKRGLLVVEGIIDNGYRGDLFFVVHNIGTQVAHVKKGDRLAQLILQPLVQANFVLTEESLDESERMENGFGSTGS